MLRLIVLDAQPISKQRRWCFLYFSVVSFAALLVFRRSFRYCFRHLLYRFPSCVGSTVLFVQNNFIVIVLQFPLLNLTVVETPGCSSFLKRLRRPNLDISCKICSAVAILVSFALCIKERKKQLEVVLTLYWQPETFTMGRTTGPKSWNDCFQGACFHHRYACLILFSWFCLWWPPLP